MAEVTYEVPVEGVKGKTTKKAKGYHYNLHGKQFYREREENYQKNQSPKQMWRSQSFAYALKAIAGVKAPEQRQALEAEYKAAKGMTPFGSHTETPLGWKKSCLMHEWQQQHPFESWYEAYLAEQTKQN